jgi:enoyl-CoA hydratase/carnithine racemase
MTTELAVADEVSNVEKAKPAIDVAASNGVAWVTLNRPAVINAVNDEVRNGLAENLARLDSDDDIRVIVLRGAGERGFCVGADIKEMRGPECLSTIRRRMVKPTWIEALDRVSKVTIASIHGFCLGGGMELALACDIRVASGDARFALPEINLGLIPGGGGTQRLPHLIGAGRALEMMLTADRIDAADALRVGLITRLWDTHEALAAGTAELAGKIAAKPPLALRYLKEAARCARDLSLGEGLRLEKDLFTMLMGTEERMAASAAFRARSGPTADTGE